MSSLELSISKSMTSRHLTGRQLPIRHSASTALDLWTSRCCVPQEALTRLCYALCSGRAKGHLEPHDPSSWLRPTLESSEAAGARVGTEPVQSRLGTALTFPTVWQWDIIFFDADSQYTRAHQGPERRENLVRGDLLIRDKDEQRLKKERTALLFASSTVEN